ncbi:MAG: hypothetical protein KJ698_09210 [Actinobacteria bacterium]|nr:hypothetical protein [Actinomycetota bacterium]MBU1493377.1 hypothetical protein [Actinomycetota bacterium]
MYEKEVLLFRVKAWAAKDEEIEGTFTAMAGASPWAGRLIPRYGVIVFATPNEITILRAGRWQHLAPVSVEARLARSTPVGPLKGLCWKEALGLSAYMGIRVFVHRKWREEIDRIDRRRWRRVD